jgi:hypothetical protein
MTATAPRKPQDHKPKATNGLFSFTHQGKQYTFPKPFSAVQSPKFMRQHRRRDETDLTFTIIEALADDDDEILDAIDSMPLGEFNKLAYRLTKALSNAVETSEELGESEAS